MFLPILCLAALFGLTVNMSLAQNEELISKLKLAAAVTKGSIVSIFNEWQVDKHPLFLKSCFMSELSWEIMKLKFQKKILSAIVTRNVEKTKFVISFTGR